MRERGCRDDADDGWRTRHAVTGPSWNDAQSYVTWLAKLTGKTHPLLSEAEYEYAAPAGATTAYPCGAAIGAVEADCSVCGPASKATGPTPVGSFRANAFGLHDMLGNVQSFVEDCWHDNYAGAPADGGRGRAAATAAPAWCAERVGEPGRGAARREPRD